MAQKKIKNALISVFHKDNLEPIIKRLNELGVTMYSTGGTQIWDIYSRPCLRLLAAKHYSFPVRYS